VSQITNIAVDHANGKIGEGLKRQMFSVDLGGVDLFVGPNGVGKTTRLISIIAAMQGLASVNTDTRRIYLGDLPANTEVTVTLDDGRQLVRDLSSNKSKASKEADGLAEKLIGRPPVSWDLRDFAGATPGQRANVLDMVARAGGDLQQWDAERAQVETLEHLDNVRDYHAIWDKLTGALPTAKTGSAWLEAAILWIVDEQRDTNAAQRNAYAYSERAKTQIGPKRVAPDETEIRQVRAELHAAQFRTQNATRAKAALKRHADEGARLNKSLTTQMSAGKALKVAETEPELSVVAQEAEVSRARAELEAPIPAWAGEDIAKLQAELERVHASVASAKVDHERATKAMIEARAAAEEYSSVAAKRCESCGSLVPAAQRQARDLADKMSDASYKVRRIEADIPAVYAEGGRLEASIKRATKGKSSHVSDITYSREQALQRAVTALEHRQAEQGDALGAWEARESVRTTSLEAARSTYRETKASLEAWETSTPPQVPEVVDTAAAKARLKTLETEQRAYEGYLIRSEQSVNAAKAAIGVVEKWETVKALQKGLKETRDELAASAYRPIEEAAQKLTEGAHGLLVPFFRGPSEYGAIIDGQEVPYHGLSESEEKITSACLVYAFSVVSHQPVKLVVIDGIEVIRDHLLDLLAALVAAQARGDVDNIMLTMATKTGEAPPDVPGLTIHQVVKTAIEVPDLVAVEIPVSTVKQPLTVETPATKHTLQELSGGSDDCPF